MDPSYFSPIPSKHKSICSPVEIIKKNPTRTRIQGGRQLFPETPKKENDQLVCPNAPRKGKRSNNNLLPFPVILFPNF